MYPLEPGFTRFRLAPQPVDLQYASGVFPTVHGDIRVAWQRQSDGIVLDVTVPDGTRAELAAPAGYTLVGAAAHLDAGSHRVRFVPC